MTVLLVDVMNKLRPIYEMGADADEAAARERTANTTIAAIRGMIRDHQATHVVCALEGDGTNWRESLAPQYKANREPTPAAVKQAVKDVEQVLSAEGVLFASQPELEADDIIGAIALKCSGHQCPVLIVSSDKDFSGLLGPYVKQVAKKGEAPRDAAWVQERFGVPPALFWDYQALVGDGTDGLAGVPGIGPKRGVELINTYGGIEDLADHAGEVKGKMGETLREYLPQLPTFLRLVRPRTDIELGFSLKDAKYPKTV